MKIAKNLVIIALFLMLSGCLPFENPPYEESDIVTIENIEGIWVGRTTMKGQYVEYRFIFKEVGNKRYKVTIEYDGELPFEFGNPTYDATFFTLKDVYNIDRYYLDIKMSTKFMNSLQPSFFHVPLEYLHTIYGLEFSKSSRSEIRLFAYNHNLANRIPNEDDEIEACLSDSGDFVYFKNNNGREILNKYATQLIWAYRTVDHTLKKRE